MRRLARFVPHCAISNPEEVLPGQVISIIDLDDVHLNLERITTAAVYGHGDKYLTLLQHDAEDDRWMLTSIELKSGKTKLYCSGDRDTMVQYFESVSRTRISKKKSPQHDLAMAS